MRNTKPFLSIQMREKHLVHVLFNEKIVFDDTTNLEEIEVPNFGKIKMRGSENFYQKIMITNGPL